MATYYYWKKMFSLYGKEGLAHANQKEQLTRLKKLEKENEQLKILLAEKELESKLKDELLKKKKSRTEKVIVVRKYMALGLNRDT